ncbi:MAG: ATP synthase epsilon chain [Candidatus Roizmanbacteria bacterium GW2011_GWA2_35_19]|uniref:ATP synthase epsilon chain n=2 Tax=Candidatus Roizmaniibacteriota TaxID=1752723 RepID=A0A0G0CBM7_9BACT|nr:MAG: ATP synthase epsilon chain [Candidatus Roizmanbacteria bacterium GW2011_GWC2_35_12]KKP73471.1 MAG: ATP synthase epsilon chain [Candidatus Roizmanbacteria bacterium GW2011_GWA2_35_19]
MLKLKIITPRKLVKEIDVESVTVPTASGEITILQRHANLFSLLIEGIVKIKEDKKEEFMAIGGGYLQTDGRGVTILVSKAYGQNDINEGQINKAYDEAKKIIKTTKDQAQKNEAVAMMRRAIIDTKLLKKRRHNPL